MKGSNENQKFLMKVYGGIHRIPSVFFQELCLLSPFLRFLNRANIQYTLYIIFWNLKKKEFLRSKTTACIICLERTPSDFFQSTALAILMYTLSLYIFFHDYNSPKEVIQFVCMFSLLFSACPSLIFERMFRFSRFF